MERTLISWNIANWITVLLMGAGGYIVLLVLSQVFLRSSPQSAGGSTY